MKLAEAKILNELKNVLCEDVRELVPIAVLEAWPAGHVPGAYKRFAPLGPEGKKQLASEAPDKTVLEIHTSKIGAANGRDIDQVSIGEALYTDCDSCDGSGFECQKCEGKGYLGGLTREQVIDLFMVEKYKYRDKEVKWPAGFRPPPTIRKLDEIWEKQSKFDREYKQLQDAAKQAQARWIRIKHEEGVPPDEISQAKSLADKAIDAAENHYASKYIDLTRSEMDEIHDDYWFWLKRLAQSTAKRHLDRVGLDFKEVDPKQYIKQAVQVTLEAYAKLSLNILILWELSGVNLGYGQDGQTIVQSPYPYVKQLFNSSSFHLKGFLELANQIEQEVSSGKRNGYLTPEEILHFAKMGAFRPQILQKLTSLHITVDFRNQKEMDNLERIIREVSENLEEEGDLKTVYRKNRDMPKELAQVADIYNINDPDLVKDRKREEEEKLRQYYQQYYENSPEELHEAQQHKQVTLSSMDMDKIPMYIPLDDDSVDEYYDTSNLPRQSWDKRRRPSQYDDSEDITWVQLVGLDYSGYDKKRSYWEPPFQKLSSKQKKQNFLSGDIEPYHAALEWLWESMINFGLDPEPYDGFARVPSRDVNLSGDLEGDLGEYAPSQVMFYNPNQPYFFKPKKNANDESGSDYRHAIYGISWLDDDRVSQFYKTGPVKNQVPIPAPVQRTASDPHSMNVEKYNTLFKVTDPSMGKTADLMKQTLIQLISENYDKLTKCGLVVKIGLGENDTNVDYELKYGQKPSSFIKVMFYAYRITRDDSDELLDVSSSNTFYKETEAMRERLRASKIFANSAEIEELAEIVDESPEVFQINGKPWRSDLIRFAIGSGPSGAGPMRFFSGDQVKSMIDRVIADASRRSGSDPFGTMPKVSDWDFPVQVLKSVLEDLQVIYTQSTGRNSGERKARKDLVQEVIDGVKHAINNAAASDAELNRRARGRAQEKEMEWWRKEGKAQEASLRYRRRNEIRHNMVKSKMALSNFLPDVKITDSDRYSFMVFELIRDMVLEYQRLIDLDEPIWNPQYEYNSFLNLKSGFENAVVDSVQKDSTYDDQEIHPETLSLFMTQEDNPRNPKYGKSQFDLSYGIQPKYSLDGEPIIAYHRAQQLDSKEDALALTYLKLKEIYDEIKSVVRTDPDLAIGMLEELIEDSD